MIATLSDATTVTISIVGLFAFIAIIALVRSLLTRKETNWLRIRVGFYVERDVKPPPFKLPSKED